MGLSAICKPALADIPSDFVNYDKWQSNIKGSRKDPHPNGLPDKPSPGQRPGLLVGSDNDQNPQDTKDAST